MSWHTANLETEFSLGKVDGHLLRRLVVRPLRRHALISGYSVLVFRVLRLADG